MPLGEILSLEKEREIKPRETHRQETAASGTLHIWGLLEWMAFRAQVSSAPHTRVRLQRERQAVLCGVFLLERVLRCGWKKDSSAPSLGFFSCFFSFTRFHFHGGFLGHGERGRLEREVRHEAVGLDLFKAVSLSLSLRGGCRVYPI